MKSTWLLQFFLPFSGCVAGVNGFLLPGIGVASRRRHVTLPCPYITLRQAQNSENQDDEEEDDIYNDSLIYDTDFTPDLTDNGNMAYNHRRQQRHEGGALVDADMKLLRQLLKSQRVKVLDSQLCRPPNARLNAVEFVKGILMALIEPDDPLPESGFRVLIRSSSSKWRRLIRSSVGAPVGADEDSIVCALAHAFLRPHNHFGILVGAEDAEDFEITFPTDVVDFNDGKCWLECQLRERQSDELLVVIGWQLKRRKGDNAWLVDTIDWQDFRDGFRPGIGREEWLRICG
mmetsp:Transcript_21416/g.43252  ORF Transcript_21416/g.43252 Transcript_21416/m.43252 type:complete len:289 (-) Transcript_21416:130-996(-)